MYNGTAFDLKEALKQEKELSLQIYNRKQDYRKISGLSSAESNYRYYESGKREDYAKELELSNINAEIHKLNEQLSDIKKIIILNTPIQP